MLFKAFHSLSLSFAIFKKEKKRKKKKNKVFDITRLSILYHYLLQFYIETPHLLRKKKI
jgi:hypothetical protein